jgi:hypothetical protein
LRRDFDDEGLFALRLDEPRDLDDGGLAICFNLLIRMHCEESTKQKWCNESKRRVSDRQEQKKNKKTDFFYALRKQSRER